jgi:hypothetical protein
MTNLNQSRRKRDELRAGVLFLPLVSSAFIVLVVRGIGARTGSKTASIRPRVRRLPGIVPVEHGRAPAIRTVAGVVAQSTRLSEKKAHTMKKQFAAALLSLAALALSTVPASAWCCCPKYKFCACAAQYNAFTPFTLNTVAGGHCCHKCCYVAELPCCPPPCCPAPCCPPPCCDPCPAGPSCFNGGDSSMLGMLPAPGGPPSAPAAPSPPAAVQGPVPAPLPQVPATTSQRWPVRMQQPMVQPAGYRPAYYPGYSYGYQPMPQNGYGYPQTMPMGAAPAYWNGGN